MSVWLKRLGLHLAAAIGATGIFVGAAAVGANQTRHQTAAVAPAPNPSAAPRRKPTVVVSPSPTPPASEKVVPERSVSGKVVEVLPDALDVQGDGGRLWRVAPAAGALLRLNGKAVHLDALRAGDAVVILGQAQTRDGPRYQFLAHAITARRK